LEALVDVCLAGIYGVGGGDVSDVWAPACEAMVWGSGVGDDADDPDAVFFKKKEAALPS